MNLARTRIHHIVHRVFMMSESETGYASREHCEELLKVINGKKRCCCKCEFFVHSEPMTREDKGFGVRTVYDGFCHRYPPADDPDGGPSQFPLVSDRDWCGEFVEGKPLTVDDVYAEWLD
jgi:hypothetical protein